MALITKDGPNFFGDLVDGEDLNEAEEERQRYFTEINILNRDIDNYKNWEVWKSSKNKSVLRKPKSDDERFEDKTWILFKRMGFQQLNKDRHFKIAVNGNPKQVDIFARDEDNVFIVECKSSIEISNRSIDHDIDDMHLAITDYKKAIRMEYGKNFRISLLIAIKNIVLSEQERDYIHSLKQEGLFILTNEDIDSYLELANQLGTITKFQFFPIIFGHKKSSELADIKVPAMRIGKGNNQYYVFVIQPGKLIKLAYVYRKELASPQQTLGAYQRLVNRKRLENIKRYLEGGGFFPNNIIINFTQKPTFEPFGGKREFGDIPYGQLTLPPYYGSAWVIDGQHRLFGYAKTDKKDSGNLIVVAFDNLDVKKQANLFVEINVNQKSINSNLLWDIYPDIYEGSDDPKQLSLRAISLIAKKLNNEKKSPFYNRIRIPSIRISQKDTNYTNLTLTNICDSISNNELITDNGGLLFRENYESSINFAFGIVKQFFDYVSNKLKEDWERGEEGLIRTNIGSSILFIILGQFIKWLDYKEISYNDSEKFKVEIKILDDIFDRLTKMSPTEKGTIKRSSSEASKLETAQKLIWDLKEKTGFGVGLWKKGGWTPDIPKDENSNDAISSLVTETEKELRKMIIFKLKEIHGKDAWFKVGIPPGVKDNIERGIQRDISKFPYMREEKEKLTQEEKLIYTDIGDLKEIIVYGQNWEKSFIKIFSKDKELTRIAFEYYAALRSMRDPIHPDRNLDEIGRGLGYWHTRWIRRCIGMDTNTYITTI